MKLFVKTAIASMAIAGMVQADTMLIGVDAGLTVYGARLGVVAGITAGSGRNYTSYSSGSYSKKSAACPSAVVAVSNPCAYVCEPCEVIAPPCAKY
ncbi:MAG TPA: hypothetical protein EYH01_00135 [Campylobacterales bacterium]|nr:hypothetical protein [Campylobacterales bacterium]